MTVRWLIETDVFPATSPPIVAALEARGIPWMRWHDDVRAEALPAHDVCVLFWGSLNAAYERRVAAAWRPGAVGDVARFACRAYHEPLAPLLANDDVLHTTVRALTAAPERVVMPLGEPDRVFVRPDSPLKPFAGRIVDVATLTPAALDHGFYYDNLDLPVVVARTREVGREWRFVVADGTVVAGSGYDPARRAHPSEVPEAAHALAARVAALTWQAAPLYVVDVGEVDGSLRVLELNPFSGADLYGCDPGDVVVAATRVAARLHRST